MNPQQAPYEVRDLFTPDSTEARTRLLLKPYSILLMLLAGFLIMELLFGHVYLLTSEVHPQKGYTAVSLPTLEHHHFEMKPRSIGFVRPRQSLCGLIWRELERLGE